MSEDKSKRRGLRALRGQIVSGKPLEVTRAPWIEEERKQQAEERERIAAENRERENVVFQVEINEALESVTEALRDIPFIAAGLAANGTINSESVTISDASIAAPGLRLSTDGTMTVGGHGGHNWFTGASGPRQHRDSPGQSIFAGVPSLLPSGTGPELPELHSRIRNQLQSVVAPAARATWGNINVYFTNRDKTPGHSIAPVQVYTELHNALPAVAEILTPARITGVGATEDIADAVESRYSTQDPYVDSVQVNSYFGQIAQSADLQHHSTRTAVELPVTNVTVAGIGTAQRLLRATVTAEADSEHAAVRQHVYSLGIGPVREVRSIVISGRAFWLVHIVRDRGFGVWMGFEKVDDNFAAVPSGSYRSESGQDGALGHVMQGIMARCGTSANSGR